MFSGTVVPPEFSKQPAEIRNWYIDYSNRLPSGVVISSVALSAVDCETGADATSTVVVNTTGTVSANRSIGQFQAGTSGKAYKLTYLSTLDNGELWEDDVIMRVQSR